VADGDDLVAGDDPAARSARCSAVVQLLTAQACGAPTKAANSCSKAATSVPASASPRPAAAHGFELGVAE
jgi:hypothetical protein